MDSKPAWMSALLRVASNAVPPEVASTDPVIPTFGTVRQLSPLRISLDSDPATVLPYEPPCLDYPTYVGQRVWVQTYGRRLVVVGVSKTSPDLPVGTGALWTAPATVAPPTPWMIAGGQSLVRAEYPEAFDVYGTTYGSADSTHFNIPDFSGRTVVGQNAGDTYFDVVGETGGERIHTLTASEMPYHAHESSSYLVNATGQGTSIVVQSGSAYGLGYGAALSTTAAGGGVGHNNMPPYIVQRWMVKVR